MIKRMAFWFGLTAYFLTFLYYEGPHGVRLNTVLFHVLPYWMCILAAGGMPVQAVLLVIAPINAAFYALFGAGLAWIIRKLRMSSRHSHSPEVAGRGPVSST